MVVLAAGATLAFVLQAAGQTLLDVVGSVHVNAKAVDAAGNIYIAGFQPGAVGKAAFIGKFTPDGRQSLYQIHFGGSLDDEAQGLVVDANGNAYVTGHTNSPDFPVTPGALHLSHPGTVATDLNGFDVFVVKFNNTGAVLYSAVVGGSGRDIGSAIAVDARGSAYVAGLTASSDFPVSPSAYLTEYSASPTQAGSFVIKLDPVGSALIYSTYFDPVQLASIAVDSSGNAYLAGTVFGSVLNTTATSAQPVSGGGFDAFASSLDATGSTLRYSTYLGGSLADWGWFVRVNSAGEAWILGQTSSMDLPLSHAIQTQLAGRICTMPGSAPGVHTAIPCDDAFIAKVSSAGDRFLFSSYFGGTGEEFTSDFLIDPAGNANLLIHSGSNFPLTGDALLKGECYSPLQGPASFVRLGADGSLLYSSFVMDPAFLTPDGSIKTWVGSSAIDAANPGPKQLACVLNAASLKPWGAGPSLVDQAHLAHYAGVVAPGEIISLFGWGLGPNQAVIATADSGGFIPKQLGGVQVLFDGVSAPILYAQSGQINAIVPYGLAGATTTSISVSYSGSTTNALNFLIDPSAPAVFAIDSSGTGPAAVLNEDGTVNSSTNPAARGSVVQIFATGGGQSNPPAHDGQINPLGMGILALPVRVQFYFPPSPGNPGEGIDAELEYAGPAPALVSGVIQVNARIPTQTVPGDLVPVWLFVGASTSSGTVSIAIK